MEVRRFGFFFMLGIILVIGFTFSRIIYDFFPAIATGIVLAYVFNDIFLRLVKWTRHRSFAAIIVIVVVIILILVPLTFLLITFQRQVYTVFNEHTMERLSRVFETIREFADAKVSFSIPDSLYDAVVTKLLTTGQEIITSLGPKMLVSITRLILSIFITLFLMYYLLIRSENIIHTFKDYFPISYRNCDILIERMGRDTRSLIFGQLLVAIIQGVFGSIGFFIFGVPGWILWGMVMAIASFLPVFGAGLVWVPAVVILLIQESYFNGIGLLIWSAIVVSSLDNIIRPKLTNALGELHPVTVLLGVFIGIKEWGFIGLVLGPLMISVLITLIKMFREEYIEE